MTDDERTYGIANISESSETGLIMFCRPRVSTAPKLSPRAKLWG
jgi:hypothetical protein